MLSRKTPPTARPSLRDDSGFTLIEVVIAMAIFAVLLGATLNFFASAEQTANKDTEMASAAAEARNGLNRLVRDLRQASAIITAAPNTLDVLLVDGTEVRYTCDLPDPNDSRYRQCSRSAGAEGALGAGEVIVARLANGTTDRPVFSYTIPPPPEVDPEDEADDPADPAAVQQPNYVRATVAVPAAGERKAGGYRHEIVYDAGLYLRNIDYAGIGEGA